MGNCTHPESERHPYHDDSVVCGACNSVIEQFGKKLSEPYPLGQTFPSFEREARLDQLVTRPASDGVTQVDLRDVGTGIQRASGTYIALLLQLEGSKWSQIDVLNDIMELLDISPDDLVARRKELEKDLIG